MKLRKRRVKGVRWYRRELRHIQGLAEGALHCPKTYEQTIVAIVALAQAAAIGREAYLER